MRKKEFITTFYSLILILGSSLLFNAQASLPFHGGIEEYYILQKGFITVQGKTNFFNFAGESLRHEGELIEEEGGYTGTIILRFKNLGFDVPGTNAMLEDPEFLNTTRYPKIKIQLKEFVPFSSPKAVQGNLRLRGVEREVTIYTKIEYQNPIVTVRGSFIINQSDFGIKPYKVGFLKVKDQLEINFKVFFCEIHDGEPPDPYPGPKERARILKEDNITLLTEEDFYGCKELKNKIKVEE